MAMFTRLKTAYILQRCCRLNFSPKTNFSALPSRSSGSPPANTRSFYKLFGITTKHDLKKADDIPNLFVMIYRNTMSNYILGAQIVSLVTSGTVLLALMLRADMPQYPRKTLEWSPLAKPVKNEEIYYISIFIMILVIVQQFVSRTPIRIYKVPKTSKYIAVNYGNYFFGKKRYSFHSGEISQMKERGILPWRENRYLIKSETERKPILLMPHYFRRPADLNIMLGEQKDPELEDEK